MSVGCTVATPRGRGKLLDMPGIAVVPQGQGALNFKLKQS
jgi:hypothetical protein